MELNGFYQSLRIPVTEISQISEVRRLSKRLASELQFDEIKLELVSIVATEIASNLVKHAKEGEVLLRGIMDGGMKGVEILSLDKGPGIEDISKSLEDGHSTVGSFGTGLGAIRRISSSLDLVSSLNSGTAMSAKIWASKNHIEQKDDKFLIGSVCVPVEGEVECGDSWRAIQSGSRCLIIVADGLGHGPLAAEASQEAIRIFLAYKDHSPAQILDIANGALSKTRGAAVAIAQIDLDRRMLTYSGVGNISGSIVTGASQKSLVSSNGTVGIGPSRAREYSYPWTPDSFLILASDGIHSNWKLDRFPGILLHEPSLVSGVLFKNWERGRDDVTVVTVRER